MIDHPDCDGYEFFDTFTKFKSFLNILKKLMMLRFQVTHGSHQLEKSLISIPGCGFS